MSVTTLDRARPARTVAPRRWARSETDVGTASLSGTADGAAGARGRPAGPRDRGDPCRDPAALRQPADSRRIGGPRLSPEPQARAVSDAGPQVRRPAPHQQ